jgi:hypothetical protein
MSLFVLTINNLSPALEKQHQEVAHLQSCLQSAALAVRRAGGKQTSGNISNGATVVGSWTYTPQAAS